MVDIWFGQSTLKTDKIQFEPNEKYKSNYIRPTKCSADLYIAREYAYVTFICSPEAKMSNSFVKIRNGEGENICVDAVSRRCSLLPAERSKREWRLTFMLHGV
jgi:hypothetical protein